MSEYLKIAGTCAEWLIAQSEAGDCPPHIFHMVSYALENWAGHLEATAAGDRLVIDREGRYWPEWATEAVWTEDRFFANQQLDDLAEVALKAFRETPAEPSDAMPDGAQ